MNDAPTIRTCYRFKNGMIMSFSAAGLQLAHLQGRDTPELRTLIEINSDQTTLFYGFGAAPLTWGVTNMQSPLRKADVFRPATPSMYPANWPKCPNCGEPALDGHITCGKATCCEGERRNGVCE